MNVDKNRFVRVATCLDEQKEYSFFVLCRDEKHLILFGTPFVILSASRKEFKTARMTTTRNLLKAFSKGE